jgi:NAD(P)-dependent dehydrogenase (short-subunit alcohol dehydrogenase family)
LSKSASWGSIRSSHENRSGYFIDAIIAPSMPYLADIGDPKAVAEMVASTQQKFGALDIVVCNAAVRPHQAFLDISLADWDRTLRTNLSSCFFIARAALPLMAERKWARMIHISGMDGYTGQTNRAHNVVCKAGVHALAKALGTNLARTGSQRMWLRRVGLIQSAIGRSTRRFEMKKKFDEFRSAASVPSPTSLPRASILRHHPPASSTVKSFMQTAGDTCFKSR